MKLTFGVICEPCFSSRLIVLNIKRIAPMTLRCLEAMAGRQRTLQRSDDYFTSCLAFF